MYLKHNAWEKEHIWTMGNNAVIVYSQNHTPVEPVKRNRKKEISVFYKFTKNYWMHDSKKVLYNSRNYTLPALELSFGLYYGIRIGIVLGELVDFIVGIFGYDPLDDDELHNGKIRWEIEEKTN